MPLPGAWYSVSSLRIVKAAFNDLSEASETQPSPVLHFKNVPKIASKVRVFRRSNVLARPSSDCEFLWTCRDCCDPSSEGTSTWWLWSLMYRLLSK